MAQRSYNQFCALAFALDLIGERWTLLIIRELLTGPKRFTDLQEGLPGISTNLLSERLKTLEQHGLARRRTLPPPAASMVYELTDVGAALESAMLALGQWGSRFLPPSLDGLALPSAGAMALAIKAFFRTAQARGVRETYELHLDEAVLTVAVDDGNIDVRQGETSHPDAVIHTQMPVFVALFAGQMTPDDALSGGLVRIDGEQQALQRFLSLTGVEAPAA
ncbi:MAG: winged helix-turn-helix transcriptional regulator [Chloroflexota bacterium]|nr:MAG: transcriptional regulator [Chloroflexota bacterium]